MKPSKYTQVVETKLVNGVYVIERRDLCERRAGKAVYRGYDRRARADRREARKIDAYV
ncbi:hypothetical protein [Enterovibrio coralii]|uniref:hypothetical protein n=1 Tax=Enterovibrio coralii TaxID=294935 RepID=UPI000AB9E247|nr:hypothetical protein [Enterovibrio coralii]